MPANTAAVWKWTESPPQAASSEAQARLSGVSPAPERAESPPPSSKKPVSSARLSFSPRPVRTARSPARRENTPAASSAPVRALKATT